MLSPIKYFLPFYFWDSLTVNSVAISSTSEFLPRSDFRCGIDENDARTTCGKLCIYISDCGSGEYCWSTFPNKCYVNELTVDLPEASPTPVTASPITTRPVSTSPRSSIPSVTETINSMTPVDSDPSPLIPLRTDFRCGIDEQDSRTNCGKLCIFNSDCNSGEYCWSTFPNECYINDTPMISPEDTLAPNDSTMITSAPFTSSPVTIAPVTFAPIAPSPVKITLAPVTTSAPIASMVSTSTPVVPTSVPVESTSAPVVPNLAPTDPTKAPADSTTTTPVDATLAPVSAAPITLLTAAPLEPTNFPATLAPAVTPTLSPVGPTPSPVNPTLVPVTTSSPVNRLPISADPSSSPSEYPLRSDFRCGIDEEDSRTNCGKVCVFISDCDSGEYCWSTFLNKCYVNTLPMAPSEVTSPPPPLNAEPQSDFRCGTSEADARGNCKRECTTHDECASGEYCWATLPNYCYAN